MKELQVVLNEISRTLERQNELTVSLLEFWEGQEERCSARDERHEARELEKHDAYVAQLRTATKREEAQLADRAIGLRRLHAVSDLVEAFEKWKRLDD